MEAKVKRFHSEDRDGGPAGGYILGIEMTHVLVKQSQQAIQQTQL